MPLFKKKAKTARTARADAGERLQLTVLFYDLVGSTSLSEARDAEALRETLSDLHALARDLVSENGGSLEQVMGDGGMAYFGYPVLREDAALLAVETGLALLEGAAELAGAPGIRIGIATSVVVVPDRPDAASGAALGAVGVAPNLAARLEKAAAPGTILVSSETWSLTQGAFEYEAVPGLDFKGFPDMTRAWRPDGRRAAATRFERDRARGEGLAGRDAERATLDAALRNTLAGRGGVVMVEGEPGIGKSHLVAHLIEAAESLRTLVLQATPRTEGDALYALIQMYEAAHAAGEDAPLMAAAERTAEALETLEADETLSPDARREAIVTAVAEALWALGRDAPMLVVVEDLHWADEVTLAVLERLAARAGTSRMLLVMTTRAGGGTDLLREDAALIRLDKVDPDTAAVLVGRSATGTLGDAVQAWILETAGGNPLFLVELTRYASGRVARGHGVDSLRGADVGTLRDLLAVRLESAGRAKRVARIASVLGRTYPHHLLGRLARDIDSAELEADLQRLIDHGLMEAQRNGYLYAFQHALIRDVAYDSQPRSVRGALHGQVVDLVDADPDLEEDVPEILLAEHCLAAGRTARGLDLLVSVAEEAIRRSALTAPRAMLERVLDTSATLPEDTARAHLQLRAIALLGPVVTLLDGHAAAAPLYERGHALYFEVPLAERAPYFPVLWGWWFTATDLKEQARRGEALIRDVPQGADAESRLQALHCGWATLFDGGAHARCLDAIRDGLDLFDDEAARHARYLYGHDAKVCGLGEQALCCWFTGQLDASAEAIAACERWADETGHLSSQLHGLDIAMQLAVFNQDLDEIDRILSRTAALAGEAAAPVIAAKRQIFEGWIGTRRGRKGLGAQVQAGIRALRDIGVLEDTPFYADIAAEVAGANGDIAQALQVVEAEIAASEASGLTYWLAELHRRKAVLSGPARGPDALDRALAVALEQGAHHLVLRNLATRSDLGLVIPEAAKRAGRAALERMSRCALRTKVADAIAV